MVKTKTRSKCVQTKPIAIVEDQIDAALTEKRSAFPDHSPVIALRPYDLKLRMHMDFLLGDQSDRKTFLPGKGRDFDPLCDEERERKRSDYFMSREMHLSSVIPFLKSHSISDACVQLWKASTILEDGLDGANVDFESQQKIADARRCVFGALFGIAKHSERPLHKAIAPWLFRKAAEDFGDVKLASQIRRLELSKDEPHNIPGFEGDDAALVALCEEFVRLEGLWQDEINSTLNDDENVRVEQKYDAQRESIFHEIFKSKATTLAGHIARARVISAECSWETQTIEADGWDRGMLGALVRDLLDTGSPILQPDDAKILEKVESWKKATAKRNWIDNSYPQAGNITREREKERDEKWDKARDVQFDLEVEIAATRALSVRALCAKAHVAKAVFLEMHQGVTLDSNEELLLSVVSDLLCVLGGEA